MFASNKVNASNAASNWSASNNDRDSRVEGGSKGRSKSAQGSVEAVAQVEFCGTKGVQRVVLGDESKPGDVPASTSREDQQKALADDGMECGVDRGGRDEVDGQKNHSSGSEENSGGVEPQSSDADQQGRGSAVPVDGGAGVGLDGAKQRWERVKYNAYQREYMRKRRAGSAV